MRRVDLPDVADDEAGDAPCWLNRVCPECGRLNAAAHPEACEACGAEFPADY